MRGPGKQGAARFVGSGSGIHFIRSVYSRLARKSVSKRSRTDNTEHLVPGEDDQLRLEATSTSRDGDLGNEQYLWHEHEVAEHDNARPSFEQLVAWSKSYFEAWHPVMPFLHAPDILRVFEDISNVGIGAVGHLDAAIVKAVISISLADSRQGAGVDDLQRHGPPPPSLLFRTADDALSSSQFPLRQPASIRTVQTALAIQLFLVSLLRLNSASRLGGLIVRIAFHLGLHRCPSRFASFTKQEVRLRRRVFWSIYCQERFLCLSLGLPLDIRDDDVDVCFPDDERHGVLPITPDPEDAVLHLLGHVARHARIRGLILELRNKTIATRQDTADRASYVHAELAKWSNDIQDAVEEETETGLSPGHRVLLLLLKHESTISLNRPMIASDPASAAYSAALQNCIFAAKSIFIILKRHHGSPSAAPLLWPSFTWAVWISAFVLAYAAFEKQVPLATALKHVESGKELLRHIAARNTSWPEYCLSAIDELTAAVRELSGPNPVAVSPQTNTSSGRTDFTSRAEKSQPSRPRQSTKRQERARVDSASTLTRAGGVSPVPSVAAGPSGVPLFQTMSSDGQITEYEVNLSRQGMTEDHRWTRPSPRPAANGPSNLSWTSGSPPDQTYNSPIVGDSSMTLAAVQHPLETPPAADEGQGPIVWYDQLFVNPFGAIEYPYLAATTQLDPLVDPTWSLLR
jgi:hypothetical protein